MPFSTILAPATWLAKVFQMNTLEMVRRFIRFSEGDPAADRELDAAKTRVLELQAAAETRHRVAAIIDCLRGNLNSTRCFLARKRNDCGVSAFLLPHDLIRDESAARETYGQLFDYLIGDLADALRVPCVCGDKAFVLAEPPDLAFFARSVDGNENTATFHSLCLGCGTLENAIGRT